jgi:hypothetical protein
MKCNEAQKTMQTILKILQISRIVFFSLLMGLFLFAAYLWFNPNNDEIVPTDSKPTVSETNKVVTTVEAPKVEEKTVFTDIFLEVPFTSQAPSGKWNNPLFENGCEEASVAMAMAWTRGKTFSVANAEKEILDISAWEGKILGFAIDASIADTARIFREYYNYQDIEVLKNITSDDIKKELMKGRIVIAPADGKILANPHYTPPGPDQHMLVVSGYDSKTDEFITNDPGTKFGEKYRYDAGVFEAAIWSYPSGAVHAPYPGVLAAKKDIISIGKK